jgi:hypothetical protein
MQNSAGEKLFNYWDSLRAGRELLPRAEFNPARMAPILPYMFILEPDGDSENIKFRLAGTSLYNLFQRELTHTKFADIWASGTQDFVRAATLECMEKNMPMTLDAEANVEENSARAATITLLPLSATGTRSDRIVGVLDIAKVSSYASSRHLTGLFLYKRSKIVLEACTGSGTFKHA